MFHGGTRKCLWSWPCIHSNLRIRQLSGVPSSDTHMILNTALGEPYIFFFPSLIFLVPTGSIVSPLPPPPPPLPGSPMSGLQSKPSGLGVRRCPQLCHCWPGLEHCIWMEAADQISIALGLLQPELWAVECSAAWNVEEEEGPGPSPLSP